jgi:PAS domain S-box-containing protein
MGARADIAEIAASRANACSGPAWREVDRLAALDRYAILDTGREAAFDDVAELAADILDAPIAVVNFIAADRQWFKAEKGIGTDTLPLDVSICRHAILQKGVLVVPDLTQDERFDCNPLVRESDGLRFYAGALLETPEGFPLGTVCVLDTKTRPEGISPRQERALLALAAQTMAQLDLRRSNATAQGETARLSAMFAQATVGMSEIGLDQRFLEVNDRLCDMLGRSRAELLTLRMSDVTHPDDLTENIPLFSHMLETGASFSLDKRYLRPDGAVVWANSSVTRLLDESGRPRAALAVTADITVRREEEQRRAFLLTLSDELRLLTSPAKIASVAAKLIGERFNLSRVFYAEIKDNLMRVEEDYAVGVASLVGDHDLTAFGPELLRAYHECPVVKVENVQVDPRFSKEARAGLEVRQVGAYLDVVLFEEEDWVSLLALQSAKPRMWPSSHEQLFREVGERVRVAIERARAEEQLRDLNETLERQVGERTSELRRYHDIVDATVAPICAFDTSYRLIAFNRAHNDEFRRVNGFETQVGDVFPDLFVPEQASKMRALMARALSGERFTVVEEFGRPELGKPCWEITYTPLLDGEGRVVGAFHHAVDVSERLVAQAKLEAAQDALRQSQKMEAMGQLTGGVAHDFNNLLTPIIGSLDLLQRKQLGGEREQRLIAGAAQSAERAKTLVQRLLAFARRQPLQPVSVDIAKLLVGMRDLIASTTGPHIKILIKAPDRLPPAKADPNQLEMALLNLAVNARDAMPDAGTLLFTACTEEVRQEHRSKLAPGSYLRLSVADTGVGMDEETMARAIEPFFSTKGIGKGTGLGLSMVHGLTSQLGGALAIQSRAGHGTIVELWLPVSDAAPEAVGISEEASQAAFGRGVALLVDDEELVRNSTADMLTDLGYDVVEAETAEDALGLLKRGDRYDLLVTDHLMPGMNGTELARLVRSREQSMPILLVSGYAEMEGVDPSLPRLIKPFRRDELARSLANLPLPMTS